MGFKLIIVLMMSVALVLTMTSSFGNSQPINDVYNAAQAVKVTQANLTVGFGSVTFGTLNFPDVFGIFGGMASLLGSISGLIGQVFEPLNSLPSPLLQFMTALMLILFAISIIGWWKGNEAG